MIARKKKITINDIARICKVSKTTVSRALNNSANVKKETKEKILSTIKKYNYYPNIFARGIKGRGVQDTIGIITLIRNIISQNRHMGFFSELIALLNVELSKNGYYMLLKAFEEKSPMVYDIINLIKSKRVSFLLILGEIDAPDVMDEILKLHIPVTLVGWEYKNKLDAIIPNEQQGIIDAVLN